MKNPILHIVSPFAREIAVVVRSCEAGCLPVEVLRAMVDPYQRRTREERREAILEAVESGLVYMAKRDGEVCICAPWVDVPEVVSAHPSVFRQSGLFAPVQRPAVKAGKGSNRVVAVPPEATQAVWEAYLRVTGRRVSQTKDRMRACKELAARYKLQDIERAFRGLMRSDFHRGDNPQGVKYLEPHLVARSFEMFFGLGGGDNG